MGKYKILFVFLLVFLLIPSIGLTAPLQVLEYNVVDIVNDLQLGKAIPLDKYSEFQPWGSATLDSYYKDGAYVQYYKIEQGNEEVTIAVNKDTGNIRFLRIVCSGNVINQLKVIAASIYGEPIVNTAPIGGYNYKGENYRGLLVGPNPYSGQITTLQLMWGNK